MQTELLTVPTAIERLREAAPGSGHVLSAYLDTSPEQVHGQGVLLAFRQHRRALRATITPAEQAAYERTADQLDRYLAEAFRPAGSGLALFATADPDRLTAVPLPARPRELLLWGEGPALGPVVALLDDEERLAVVLFDSERTRLFTVYLGSLETRQEFVDDVPGKQDTGGWYALAQTRYARHREAQLLRHAKRTVSALLTTLRSRPFDRLLLGGPDEAVAVLREHLPRPLRVRFAGTLSLPLFASDAAVLAQARLAGVRLERADELAAVRELLDAVGSPHAVVGLAETLAALNAGRVHRLLMSRDPKGEGFRCAGCATLLANPGPCPSCGAATTPLADLGDTIIADALTQGARVDVVAGEAAALLAPHAGLGAWTRYGAPEEGAAPERSG